MRFYPHSVSQEVYKERIISQFLPQNIDEISVERIAKIRTD